MRHAIALALVCASLALAVTARAEILGDYLGYTACQPCHQKQVAGWKTTRHASAFANLMTQGAEKQTIPGCFKCHVVGFEQDGGYIDMQLTPELKDVQCEACHGPGRAHVESGGDKTQIIDRPGADSCRVCHTKGQDRNFNFAKKRKGLHGPGK